MKLFLVAATLAYASSILAAPNPAPETAGGIVSWKLREIANSEASDSDIGWERRNLERRSVTGTVSSRASALLCRTCPKTSCTALLQYAQGAKITITCRTEKNTTVVESWPWWDRIPSSKGTCYVADTYVDWTGGTPSIC